MSRLGEIGPRLGCSSCLAAAREVQAIAIGPHRSVEKCPQRPVPRVPSQVLLHCARRFRALAELLGPLRSRRDAAGAGPDRPGLRRPGAAGAGPDRPRWCVGARRCLVASLSARCSPPGARGPGWAAQGRQGERRAPRGRARLARVVGGGGVLVGRRHCVGAVSYTHLTLPTILRV